jgi:membrane dipeptidase
MTIDPQTFHFDAIVVDGHCDTLGAVLRGERTLDQRSDRGHVDLPRLRDGGVTGQVFACFTPVHEYHRSATRYALDMIDELHQAIGAHPGDLLLATGAADIRRAKAEGRIAGILGLEGAEPLGDSLAVLRSFHRLGVRVLGLTWNFRNEVADGVMEGHDARGLTPFGVQVVEECNRLGVLLDVSHLAPAGVEDVLRVSQQPVIASHSNARSLCDHMRNLSDAQIEAIARGGGLAGVTFVDAFLHQPAAKATIEHALDHIDHLLRVAGSDHVMIGSDFDGATMPEGLEDATRYPALTAGMLARGHDERTVRQVLGLNFLRVFEQVTGR